MLEVFSAAAQISFASLRLQHVENYIYFQLYICWLFRVRIAATATMNMTCRVSIFPLASHGTALHFHCHPVRYHEDLVADFSRQAAFVTCVEIVI